MGGPPPPEWATSLIDPASDPILAPTLGVTIEGGEGAAAATTSTTSRSTRKRPRSLSPGPSSSKKQHKLLNDMPDSLTLIEQLQSTNATIRNEALNKLMKVSCSHDVNYALGIHGDDILDALVHIVYQCLNWKPKEALSTDNSSNNANDTSNASTLTKGTFVASTAWMSPPHPDAQLWADHCIYEYHKLRGQTDLASQERSQLLDAISVILRNLSYVAANLRLLAYNPKVLQILIGFLYDCGNTTHLISSIGDSALETVSSSSSSSTATSNSSSLALHSLQTFVHLAPYLDLTGQKMYADRMFLIPDKLDAEGLLPHSNSTCSMYGQARQNLGWGGMWLAKRLDVKEDVVLDTSPELILEHTEPYLCSVWSLFPALTHVMKTTTSPRTVIMTAMDFIKELLDHHSSVQDGDNDSDDEEEEEDDNSNDGATNENNEGKDNNDSNDKDVPIVEQQEMMGIGEDQYKKPNPKKQQKNKKGKSATTKRKVSLPNPRKVLIHVPDVILDRLVDLLWVPRLGPDSLEYLNPINNIVSRVSTLKLLMGYDATVDTDLRDRSLDVLVPLLDLSSPKLARRLGLVDRTNKITNKTTTSSNDDDDKPTTIAPPRMTTRTRLYDALVPALTTTVGRNDAPNLASVLFGQLGKAKENRIGLLYVQSRLLKLASRDPRAAQLACNQLYVDHDVASLQTKKSDNNYVEVGQSNTSGQSNASLNTRTESDASDGKNLKDTPTCTCPLSWEEARKKIREILEQYMKTRPPEFTQIPGRSEFESSETSRFWELDLDLWASALPASIALLVLACISYSQQADGDSSSRINARGSLNLYKSQIAASVLFLAGSLLSILLVRRRRWSCKKDGDVSKRHTILKFLLKLNQMDAVEEKLHVSSPVHHEDLNHRTLESIPLSGTSLTDIYPVYRRSSTEKNMCAWHRVPTLLLTKGDYISLQVGDIAPSKCRMAYVGSKGGIMSTVVIPGGERVSLELLGEDRYSAFSSIPRGRTSVPLDSRDLLRLCNRMRIFVLEETPLEDFLYLPQVKKRPPQLHRQIMAVRKALYVLAVGVFILTSLIIFVRPHISNRDLSILLPLPFVAALGILPVTTPIGAFFLEVFGTARILVAVHPHVLPQHSTGFAKADTPIGNMLFFRYILATAASRLSLQEAAREFRTFVRQIRIFPRNRDTANSYQEDETGIHHSGLVHVPPASSYLLEKLGVATAFAMVDDELACEPHSTPQQLLIPSGKGLKLLDLCPAGGYESDSKSDSGQSEGRRVRSRSFNDDSDDSESDDEQKYQHISIPKRKLKALRKGLRKRNAKRKSGDESSDTSESKLDENEVQFEDPLWWQHLPSLKCVGLASILVDDIDMLGRDHRHELQIPREKDILISQTHQEVEMAERDLVSHICVERKRSQLHSLAQCIGFTSDKNSLERRTFNEVMRIHCVSTEILRERMAIDTHALGLEESRRWDMLRSDSTSVIVQDRRSKAYQLLTVGDARVVAGFCQEAWQGESSTILPFSASDKRTILDTSDNWRLGDLDVAAFSYSPVPHTWEQRLLGVGKRLSSTVYLIDNAAIPDSPHSAATSEDWSLVNNQIFLGVLGSLVTPRKEIETILEVFSEAGVRFVYFSPRNMRRTKELALQMGIDVAWNCAISLRPLDEGEEDPHRMTSTYADWDVNAKLPHGIDAVRQHLEEVDNVPLLVSLFTDVTKDTTKEMLKTFQEYSDTVMVMGLSHLPRNAGIFASVDLAVGIDVLLESLDQCSETFFKPNADMLLPCEVAFVSSIASHSCLFNLNGAASTSHMPFIITQGRGALDAATSAGTFVISGCLSFSLYVLLCVCTPSTTVPYVPLVGSVLYLQVVLPWVGIAIAMSEPDAQSMQRVPPKNDKAVVFGRREGKRLYINAVLKAVPPALLPQLLYLIAFGELMSKFEPDLVSSSCPGESWASLVRCDALWEYTGPARTSASSLLLAEVVLCVVVASASFVYRSIPIWEEHPWKGNHAWLYSVALGILFVAVFLVITLEDGTFASLPWYFPVLALLMPLICISCNEAVKFYDSKQEKRAVMLRRLQFETRLGMWSPK